MNNTNTQENKYGIGLESLEDINSYQYKIPVDNDFTVRLSEIFTAAPTLFSNDLVKSELGNGIYRITFNGENVTPNMLFEKKNGKLISNLKGKNGEFGKQADIEKFDVSLIDSATLVSSAFAIASVATAQYYLKDISDKLTDIRTTTQDIMHFLNVDKQSKIESDFEILGYIVDNMDVIKEDDNLKSIKMEQIASIQRDSKANILFYKNLLDKALNEYISNKMGGKQDDKIVGWVRQDYLYYRLSLQVYSLTRLSEVLLINKCSEKYLRSIHDELHQYSQDIKEEINRILSIIYDYSYDKLDNKMKHQYAKTMKTVGGVVNKTILKKTDIGGKLTNIGNKTNQEIDGDIKQKADRIVTRYDYGVIEPYSEMVESMLKLISGTVGFLKDQDQYYLTY